MDFKNKYMREKIREILSINDVAAIYGTGEGAKDIYNVLYEEGLIHKVKYIVDRDEVAKVGAFFKGMRVCSLSECLLDEELQVIFIGARTNADVIMERLKDDFRIRDRKILYGNPFVRMNAPTECRDYTLYLERQVIRSQKDFCPFEKHDFRREDSDTKLIAWYLPQFYEIEENNLVHGQGFTEWSNSSRMVPLFVGHYQPHIPYDVGYYNLLNVDTWKRQIFLAQNYGIYGFCFHYYWFSGRRIMEKTIELFLAHKELDMPFCLNWATENWSAVWDNDSDKHIMFEQKLREEDDELFMKDILPYFYDERYIKIDGRPVLSIYRTDIFEEKRFARLIDNFRRIVKENGFPDLYLLIATATRRWKEDWWSGADAIVEFPPNAVWIEEMQLSGYLNPYFKGRIFNAEKYIDDKVFMHNYDEMTVFRGAMVSYDNTPRRCLSGASIYLGISPEKYKIWLKTLVADSMKVHSSNTNYVFINSWNEWAEGAHLEPDMKYGYAYLQATYEAIMESREILD